MYLLLVAGACAHAPEGDPSATPEAVTPPPFVRVPAASEKKKTVSLKPAPAETIDGRGVTLPDRIAIDADLAHTSAVLASLRQAADRASRQPAPRAVLAQWNRLLERVDRYLDQPPRRTPAVELVRTRVTLESELNTDARTWRLPGSLVDRARSRIAYLGHRIQQGRGRLQSLPESTRSFALKWPIDPIIVNSGFGWRKDPLRRRRKGFHYGLDLEAYFGQVISSSAPGVVTWSGWNGGHGRQVEVAHPGGWVTRYSHLSHILVHKGHRVATGDPIGLAGSSGRSTGPHLHFEVWHAGDAQDPLEVLGDPVLMALDEPAGVGGAW